jgi:hypothetical protein
MDDVQLIHRFLTQVERTLRTLRYRFLTQQTFPYVGQPRRWKTDSLRAVCLESVE